MYVDNAKRLLSESRVGANPFEGFQPSVPSGVRLHANTPEFDEAEERGLYESAYTGFVLVAGGLGERLGYDGIKVELPVDTITNKCFLQYYIEYIIVLQDRARKSRSDASVVLPLAIMTSGDTHEATLALLNSNDYFGMSSTQVTLIKQEKVPSLVDNEAHFATDGKYSIATKPHGHGDVHSLLHSSGIIEKWVSENINWVVFFQDTNALVFRSILAALGVSSSKEFEVNSLTVPRKAGEAVGGICKLTKDDGTMMTINVEYNQLDPLLRSSVNPDGDVADESGYSPYPGNINVLIFATPPYLKVLNATSGAVPEFVNPKYSDSSKTVFKKPTRLECMMQDYPKLLDAKSKVGFTQLDRWISFSAVKNNLVDAIDKVRTTGFPECASSGEDDFYNLNCRLLQLNPGTSISSSNFDRVYAGINIASPARVVLHPSFGLTQKEIRDKITGSSILISSDSVLVVEGDVHIKNLSLNGALKLSSSNSSSIIVDGLTVHNLGSEFESIDVANTDIPEKYRIRGYINRLDEMDVYEFCDGNTHVLSK